MGKRIIINGVDISGCEFAEISEMIRPNQEKPPVKCKILKDLKQVFHCTCAYNKDCYHKQLQREKQKNDELVSQLDFTVQKLEVAEQKNEELQSELDNLKEIIKNFCGCKTRNDNTNLPICEDEEKYKQSLKEIGEIGVNLRTRTDYDSEDEVNK